MEKSNYTQLELERYKATLEKVRKIILGEHLLFNAAAVGHHHILNYLLALFQINNVNIDNLLNHVS